MTRAALALLALAACGAPFESQIGPPPPRDEGGAELAPPLDGGRAPDAGDVDARPSDDAHEGGRHPRPDAGERDAPDPPDVETHDPAPEASTCVAYPPAAPSVCDGMPAGGVTYCIMVGIGTAYDQTATPSACRCLADYTCACVLAAAPDPCAGFGKLAACMMFEGVPVVQCT
jgi:hypothetical protein